MRERFAVDFRGGRELLGLLDGANCKVTYVTPATVPDAPAGSWLLYVRLSEDLGAIFGIERELLVYCVNAADLQARVYNQLSWEMGKARRQVEDMRACVVISDTRAAARVEQMSGGETILLAPIVVQNLVGQDQHGDALGQLSRVLSKWWFARDLYVQYTPVMGRAFFGRSQDVQRLNRSIAEGRSIGLFGLRKIGKTSLLREVQRRGLDQPNSITVVHDLQISAGRGSAEHAAWSISRNISKVLQKTGLLTRDKIRRFFNPGSSYDPERAYIADLIDGLDGALSGELEELRVGLYLDEIECLWPPGKEPVKGTLELFQGLRAIAQSTGRLTIVVAGVNSSVAEQTLMAGIDNPLFGMLEPMYLGPLDSDDAIALIRDLGKQMGFRWERGDALALASSLGYHPLLVRLAASEVIKPLEKRSKPALVEHGDVQAALEEFTTTHREQLVQIIESLEHHYPEEKEIFEAIVAGRRDEALEWMLAYPLAERHLVGYGLLDDADKGPTIAPLSTMLNPGGSGD
jgi:serine/threonine-protein kinase